MINGVLVERTVKDVVPQLKTNTDGLKKVLDDLLKQYQSKQEELEKWKVRLSSGRSTFAGLCSLTHLTEEEQDSGRAAMRSAGNKKRDRRHKSSSGPSTANVLQLCTRAEFQGRTHPEERPLRDGTMIHRSSHGPCTFPFGT